MLLICTEWRRLHSRSHSRAGLMHIFLCTSNAMCVIMTWCSIELLLTVYLPTWDMGLNVSKQQADDYVNITLFYIVPSHFSYLPHVCKFKEDLIMSVHDIIILSTYLCILCFMIESFKISEWNYRIDLSVRVLSIWYFDYTTYDLLYYRTLIKYTLL